MMKPFYAPRKPRVSDEERTRRRKEEAERQQKEDDYNAYLDTLYARHFPQPVMVELLPRLTPQERATLAEKMKAARHFWEGLVERSELPPVEE